MSSKPKLPPFNAVPPRAMRDRRLRNAHHSVMQCIASHDRFSAYRDGQACWAGIRCMARETELHHVTVADAINDLIAWGYLSAERKTQNRRFLTIVYVEQVSVDETDTHPHQVLTDETDTVLTDETDRSTSLNHYLESNSAEAGTSRGDVPDTPQENGSFHSVEETDCAEAHSDDGWSEAIYARAKDLKAEQDWFNESNQVAAYLRQTQCKANTSYFTVPEALETMAHLYAIMDTIDLRDRLHGWATGLNETVATYLPEPLTETTSPMPRAAPNGHAP